MKEIGGYLDFEINHNYEYHKKAIKLNSARNCLFYIIKNRNIKKILLPYYICDSVINTCKMCNCNIEFYHIDNNFLPIISQLDDNMYTYVYIVNYFGTISNHKIKKLKKLYKNIIIDNVQSFFQKPVKNIDTIYSCRKYFGVCDGAYLYTNCENKLNISEDNTTSKRLNYLFGRFENNAQDFYSDYLKNEEYLDHEKIKYMSKITKNILKGINYESVKHRRFSNFKYLNKYLKSTNKLSIRNSFGLYLYPYYSDKANTLREKMIKNKIYIPKLWPNVNTNIKEYDYVNNIVLIPIDQRYGKEEMKKIIEVVKEN